MDNEILSSEAPVVELEGVAVEPASAEDMASIFADETEGESFEGSPVEPEPKSEEGVKPVVAPDSSVGVPPSVAPPVAPAAAPAPPAVIPQVAVPAPAPIVPGTVVPPVASQGEPVQTSSAQDDAQLAQIRENLINEISARYAMPEHVKEQFMLEPEKVLPQLAARIMVDSYDAIFKTIMAQLPQMMGQRERMVETQRSVEGQFFSAFPALKDPALQQDVAAVARTYRAQNPRATLEQTIQAVGTMVSVMKGVPLPGQGQVQPSSSPQMRPPVPAGVGASRAPVPAVSGNMFSDIFSDDE